MAGGETQVETRSRQHEEVDEKEEQGMRGIFSLKKQLQHVFMKNSVDREKLTMWERKVER